MRAVKLGKMKRTQHTPDFVARVRIQFYDTILDDPTDIAQLLFSFFMLGQHSQTNNHVNNLLKYVFSFLFHYYLLNCQN